MATWLAQCRNLLVRAPNWLGDVVMCLPVLEAVKRAAPSARLLLALPAHLAELFAAAEDVDEVLPIDRRSSAAGSVLNLALTYRKGGFDSALLLPNSFGSALAVWLARIPRRAGYARDGRGWLLTAAVAATAERRALPQVEYYLELARELGGPAGSFDRARRLRLAAPEAARRQVGELLAAERRRPGAPLVVLAPCAVGPGKEWPAARFAELAVLLWDQGLEVVVVGSAGERPKIAAVVAAAGSSGAEVLDLAGRNNVAQMAALFESAAGVVGNDSGPMHLAGALGRSTVGVFVRTDPRLYRPLGPRVGAIGGPGQAPSAGEVAACLESLTSKEPAAP